MRGKIEGKGNNYASQALFGRRWTSEFNAALDAKAVRIGIRNDHVFSLVFEITNHDRSVLQASVIDGIVEIIDQIAAHGIQFKFNTGFVF